MALTNSLTRREALAVGLFHTQDHFAQPFLVWPHAQDLVECQWNLAAMDAAAIQIDERSHAAAAARAGRMGIVCEFTEA